MLPIDASTRSGDSGFGSEMSNARLRFPTRPNRVPYMKPHMSVATTAGTAYGRKIEIRKKLRP